MYLIFVYNTYFNIYATTNYKQLSAYAKLTDG